MPKQECSLRIPKLEERGDRRHLTTLRTSVAQGGQDQRKHSLNEGNADLDELIENQISLEVLKSIDLFLITSKRLVGAMVGSASGSKGWFCELKRCRFDVFSVTVVLPFSGSEELVCFAFALCFTETSR